MIKRYTLKIIILLCMFAFLLCGCKKQDSEGNENQENEVSEKTKALVEDLLSEEGTAKVQDDFEIEYSYHVPKLLIESEDAQKINEEISQSVGQLAKDSLRYIEEGVFPNSLEISWKVYEHEDIIFLVILDGYKEAASEYQVYGYNVKEGKRVGNDEVIQSLGLTEEELLKQVKREVVQDFDEIFSRLPYDEEYLKMFYDHDLILRSQTVLGIDKESISLYLDGGNCNAVVKGYVPAGPGYFWEDYKIPLKEKKEEVEKTVTNQFITASLKDNQVTIKFNKTEDSDVYLSSEASGIQDRNVEYDKEYEVKGLYSDYKDLYIMSVGHEYTPYLILLTEAGHIEFANILSGVKGNALCVFPVSGIYDAVKVSSDVRTYQNEEIETMAQTAIVKNKDGEEFDLMYSVKVSDKALYNILKVEGTLASDTITHFLESGGQYDSIYFLEMREENQLIFDESLPDLGITNRYEGNYWCNGMSEEGILYSCLIYSDTEDLFCTLAFQYSAADETVRVKVLSGAEIFDRPGEWVTMHIAFG